jgi:hypothetical protein
MLHALVASLILDYVVEFSQIILSFVPRWTLDLTEPLTEMIIRRHFWSVERCQRVTLTTSFVFLTLLLAIRITQIL